MLITVLLTAHRTNAQVNNNGNLPFGDCLSKIDQPELIKQLRSEFNATVTKLNSTKEKKPFSFTDKWNLVYYIHTGYEEDYTSGNNERNRSVNDIYINTKRKSAYTIQEIFKELNISDTPPKDAYSRESYFENSFQINRYLDIADNYRGFWFPVLISDKYLVMSFNHYYPNGNAHSWLREYFCYFEKAK